MPPRPTLPHRIEAQGYGNCLIHLFMTKTKKLFLDIKVFRCKNKVSYVRMSSSHLLSSAVNSWQSSLGADQSEATTARRHFDCKFWEFVRTLGEFSFGQGTLCWLKQLSEDLETFAPAMAKTTLIGRVLNHIHPWSDIPQSSLAFLPTLAPLVP